MVSDVFLPKLLDGRPVTFERAEGLNDFVVRLNSKKERAISRKLWLSLMEQTPCVIRSRGKEGSKAQVFARSRH